MKVFLVLIFSLSSTLAYSADFNFFKNKFLEHLKAQPYTAEIDDFRTDQCTLAPQSWAPKVQGWSHCCVEHDIAHWAGGDEESRENADLRLRHCMKNVKGLKVPAPADIFYEVVSKFGHPAAVLPTLKGKKRNSPWGYGWTYFIGHDVLKAEQKKSVCNKYEKWTKTEQYTDFINVYVEKQDEAPVELPCEVI